MLEDDSRSNLIKIINEKLLIKLVFFCFVGIILAISTMVFLGRNSTVSKCSSNSIGVGQSSIGGNFTLTDIYDKKINSNDFITEPSLIYFGYSYCPDVCPFDLYRNSLVVDILKNVDVNITPIFITIDPTRDTPNRLASFSSFIHGRKAPNDTPMIAVGSFRANHRLRAAMLVNVLCFVFSRSSLSFIILSFVGVCYCYAYIIYQARCFVNP